MTVVAPGDRVAYAGGPMVVDNPKARLKKANHSTIGSSALLDEPVATFNAKCCPNATIDRLAARP